jgi:hypothetical protein
MIATQSRWGPRVLVAGGGGERVDEIAHTGLDGAKATGSEAEERGGLVGIEGLQGLAKRYKEQSEAHAQTEAKETRGQEVSHAQSLRCYALVDDVAWHERNNDVAADAGVACLLPVRRTPLLRQQHEMCLTIHPFRSDLLVIENHSVRRGVMPEVACLRFEGGTW